MYGLLQGLQGGTRDAQSANELALRERQVAEERAMREREMGMRQREMAMREAQHGATMEQLGLQLKQQKGIDSAMEGLRGLATRDAAQQRQLGESGIMSFAPQDWTDTSERAYNQKYMGLAAAKGDAEGMNKLQMRNKLLEANDLAKQWHNDPAMREKVYEFMDRSAVPLRIERGEIDPKTKRQKTPDKILWDDGGKPHPLSEADTLRMLQGIAYSKAGLNDEAEKAFESVNKRLRDAVNVGNQRKLTAYQFESQAEERLAKAEDRDLDRLLRRDTMNTNATTRAAALEQKKLGSWQMDRLLKGEKLGQEASGYAQGLAAAHAAGPQGKVAAGIYDQHLKGTREQMRGLGLSVPGERAPMPPEKEMELALKLMETNRNLSLQGALMQIRGNYDPMAALREHLGVGAPPSSKPKKDPPPITPAAAGLAPRVSADQLRARLAVDDRIKQGGLSGMGARLIQEGAMPLSVAERRDLERQLATLEGR